MLRHCIAFLCAAVSTSASATNGLNLIGFGTESALMGGADVAVARDTTALNTNPAGLARIGARAFDGFGAVAYGMDVRHLDTFGNDTSVSNRLIPIGGFGYAQRIAGTALTAGIGLFAQGGAGNIYENMATAFGTRDDLTGIFRIARLSPGLAWQATDRLALGVSVPITYADARQKVFPGTSFFNAANPAASFFGFELKGAQTLKTGLKLGAQYRASDAVMLGATYTHKTSLPLSDGTLIANMSAIGLGRVTYRNARVDGLGLPREFGLGIAWEPRAGVLLSFKYAWLNWASSLQTSTLTATAPDNPLAPPVLSSSSANNWNNQNVFAIGAAIDLSPGARMYLGYNYGRSPIPLQNLNPLLAAIGEHHFTGGFMHRLGTEWSLAYGIEYQRSANPVYTNPALPFGPNAQERSNFPAFDLMLSRRW